MNNKIPIVFGIDNKCLLPVCVVITSILENKSNDVVYQFYILMTENINKSGLEKIERLKEKYINIDINIVLSNSKLLENAKLGKAEYYISFATYLRLFIIDLLPDLDKCLYLDADIIVLDDLSELYNIEINDYYIAGVRDYSISTINVKERQEILGVKDLDNYINAGIMIVNLKKIREDNLKFYFIQDIEKGYPLGDQDILNKRCYGKIKKIPLKYNMFNRYIDNKKILSNSVYQESEIEEAISNSAIIHFTGEHKPWLFFRSKGCREWWQYGEMFLYEDEIELLKNEENIYTQKLDWCFFIEKCKKSGIVWGFSDIGKRLSDDLQKGNVNVIAFCDSDKAKLDDSYNEIKVISVENIKNQKFNSIIIASQTAYKDIVDMLIDIGIDSKIIVRYINKNVNYYLSLMPEFHEIEIKEIYLRETGKELLDVDYKEKFLTGYKDFINDKYCFEKWLI